MRLELRGITKRFGSLVANDDITLTVEPGEIHCLLGENGAGKSTLMNVLYGLYTADSGEILLDGTPAHFDSPRDAMHAGIGMVHQHFMLIPVFSVLENVMLGNEPTRRGLLDADTARRRITEISERFGFNIDPDAMVEDLPVGVQQRVEIVKALAHDAQLLVLDEPTAVLTPQETDELMAIMRDLAASGTSIVFITHKLREVKEVADRITVIRRGRVVATASPDQSADELSALMVGRHVALQVEKRPATPGEEAFRVSDLSVFDDNGIPVVNQVSFSIRRGEILAIAGVQGNGQTELTEAILGLSERVHGEITLDGMALSGHSVRQRLDAGLGYVPEDRKKDGIVGTFSISENLMLDRSFGPPFVRHLAIQRGVRDERARQAVHEFDIRAQGVDTPVGTLSGGNQQKVVLARELSRDLRMFIASQPTRGLDVGSIEFVHERIVQTRDSGLPVLIVSSELDEVIALADRIAVMYKGEILGIVPPDVPRSTLGQMMAGIAA